MHMQLDPFCQPLTVDSQMESFYFLGLCTMQYKAKT